MWSGELINFRSDGSRLDGRHCGHWIDFDFIPVVEVNDPATEAVTVEAKLFEDLDLDSIDAVDLVVRLQDYTGRKIPVAEFKSVRTVGDVVDQVHALLVQPA